MPPTCSLDVLYLGPIFLLSTTLDEETCEIVQPVLIATTITDQLFNDLRMASFTLETPPTLVKSTDPGVSVYLKYPADTIIEAIPGSIELIMDELSLRLKRHKSVAQSGLAMAVHSTVRMHGER